jgi:hypothetical protein
MVVVTGPVITMSLSASAGSASPTSYDLHGFAVDVSGQLIGTVVGPLREGSSSSQRAWIAIETGLITRKLKMAPLDGCWVDGTDVVLPWTKEMVRRSPRIALGRGRRIAASSEQRLGEYYGLAPLGTSLLPTR